MSGGGYFGKVPSRGDFLQRNLPRAFVEPWDRWLQEGLRLSHEQLGDLWLETYLTSPVWRFALGPDACGPVTVAGVFLPSVDAVGRYFPFTLAHPLPAPAAPILLRYCRAWYDEAETLARAVLGDDFDIAAFDARTDTLPAPATEGEQRARLFRLADGGAETEAALTRLLLAASIGPCALFWSDGSKVVPPSLLFCLGLPSGENFAAFLDGNWGRWGFEEVAA